jgi:hypothetical protein
MKVLLDTNIVIDYALERQPFWQNSEQIFLLLQQGSLTDTFLPQQLATCTTSFASSGVISGHSIFWSDWLNFVL